VIYQADLDYWEAGVQITSFNTKCLRVRPIWEQPTDGTGVTKILLDPSVVFGTGFHATTRLCLENLERLLESGMKIDSVLDLGTGAQDCSPPPSWG
jgi:ribosomal protein L11 methyltransferase